MEKSFIVNFFVTLYAWFKSAFNGSVLKKIQDFFKGFFTKSSKHSFFVSFFTKSPQTKQRTQNSFVYNVFVRIMSVLSYLAKGIVKILKKSYILSGILYIYKNFFRLSVRGYGLTILAFAIVYEIFLLANSLNIMLAVVFQIIALLMIFINLSPGAVVANSVAVKKLMLIFDIDLEDYSDTVELSKKASIIFCLIGVVLGLMAIIVPPMYVFALFVGASFVCAVLINFKIGAFLVPFVFPFMPTMAIVGLILLSFLSLFFKTLYDDNFKFNKTNLDVYVILFAIVMLVSAIFSFARLNSMKIYMVYLAFMLGYFVFTNTIISKKDLYSFLTLSVISAFFVALYGVYQYVFGFAEGSTWIDTEMFSDIQTRVVSTFENPNVLGEYLLLMIPVAAAFLWSAPKKYNQFINLVALSVLGLCMIFTYSRGNWLGLIAAIIIFISFYDRKFIYAGIILAVISPLIVPESIINRFLSIGDTTDTSTSYRVYIWFGTISMLKDYWLCGIGLGSEAFNMIYPRYSYASIVAPHSHNLYLQIIAENGILGIIVFLGMMITYFKDIISCVSARKRSIVKAILIALMSGMAGYLVQGAFDNVWYNYRIVMMFFMFLAISQSAVLILRKEDEN